MAKEFPIGTIRQWESGAVIKAHDPIHPYSNGWIPLVNDAELNRIGVDCDKEAASLLRHKEPINGERFLDHEINEYRDENGEQPYKAANFKQYFGFENAGRYSFRNEFSKRFMQNKMDLDEMVCNALAEANEDAGGDKHTDKLSDEEKKRIRKKIKAGFKEDPNTFSIADARALEVIVHATREKLEEGENIKDPIKNAIYKTQKRVVDYIPEHYERFKVKLGTKNAAIAEIKEVFADNWGICDSFEAHANKKFDEYVKAYKEEIKRDSIEDFKEAFGIDIEMDTKTFYDTIISKYLTMSKSERMEHEESFKYLVYIRFALKYNKSVEGNWSLDHLPALYNLELAINTLPAGHFLSNDELNLITSQSYEGGDHGGYAWYNGDEKRINFSAACVSNGSVFGVLSNPMEFKSVLFHELGHSVSKKFGRDEAVDYKKFVVECGWTYQSKELRAGMIATGDQRSIPRTGSNSTVELISEYATKAPEEAFAEYYSFYCCNKEAIDNFLAKKDKRFLQQESKWTAKEEDEQRTLRQIMRSYVNPQDSDEQVRFRKGLEELSDRGRDVEFSLVSAWATEVESYEKTRYDASYIRQNKTMGQQETVFAYKDGKKRVVFHGGNEVEIARMNKKLCSMVEIPKEMYMHFKEKGFSNVDITACLTTHYAHVNPKKQIAPPQLKKGLMHRDDFIDHEQLLTNANVFKAMQHIYNSPELAKALSDMFGGQENDIEKSAAELYLRDEISDTEFIKSLEPKKLVETTEIKTYEKWL